MTLLARSVAQRDDEVLGLAGHGVEPLWHAPAPVYALLTQHVDDDWVDIARRVRTRARYVKGPAALVIKQGLRDLTSTSVLGADKQYAEWRIGP